MRKLVGAAKATGSLTTFDFSVNGQTVPVLVYHPDGIYNDGNTMPVILVYSDGGCCEKCAERLLKGGFADLAAEANCNILFPAQQGEGWGEADRALYLAIASSVKHDFGGENGVAEKINFMTRAHEGYALLGNEGMLYIYAEGAGADFVCDYLLNDDLKQKTFFGGEVLYLPAGVALFQPKAMPKLGSYGVPAMLVDGTAEQAAAFTAALECERPATRIVKTAVSTAPGFTAEAVMAAWDEVFFKVRRMDNGGGAELFEIPDYEAIGIRTSDETVTLSTGPIRYLTFVPAELDMSKTAAYPLVLGFHGGGNAALFHAWTAEWPLIAKENGFINIEVDQHVQRRPAEIVELLQLILKEYPAINPGKVYSTGFSMGSIKSWGLGFGYTPYFAGIAPMDALGGGRMEIGKEFDNVPVLEEGIIPTMYVMGQKDPLPGFPHQKEMNGELNTESDKTIDIVYRKNGLGNFIFDEKGCKWWGLTKETVTSRTDGVMTANCHFVAGPDGQCYTAFCDVENQSHAQIAVSARCAWDFLKQFTRNADGTISIDA